MRRFIEFIKKRWIKLQNDRMAKEMQEHYKHMRDLERIRPQNEIYERMKSHGKH